MPSVDGIFYRHRMRFLRDDMEETNGSLLPPDEFKNRRQMLHSLKASSPSRGSLKNKSFGIKFQEKQDVTESDGRRAAARMKKTIQTQQDNRLTVEHYSSLNPRDWTNRIEAGVSIWVNKSTGEVSTVCPWDPCKKERGWSGTSISSSNYHNYNTSGTLRSQTAPVSSDRRHSDLYTITQESVKEVTRRREKEAGSGASPAFPIINSMSQRGLRGRVDSNDSNYSNHSYSQKQTHGVPPDSSFDYSMGGGTPVTGRNKGDNCRINTEPWGSYDETSLNIIDDDNEEGADEFIHDAEIDVEIGTGCLVYDKSELENFFELLDTMKK
mmetsp:Transcript_2205/g.3478  ORF Transcript_2205/g.3478 Transcript_2205/m.3478 type:complete len:325 (-) Transcript_2205:240-1214(-)